MEEDNTGISGEEGMVIGVPHHGGFGYHNGYNLPEDHVSDKVRSWRAEARTGGGRYCTVLYCTGNTNKLLLQHARDSRLSLGLTTLCYCFSRTKEVSEMLV